MALHLIVDGYNLIGASGSGGLAGQEGLEWARECLLQELQAYKRAKGFRITVVFDGMGRPHPPVAVETRNGIVVAYSRGTKTADDVIVGMVARSSAGVAVVSSDRQLAERCRGLGASVIASEEFRARMAALRMEEAEDEEEDEPERKRLGTRKKGPAARASKKRRRDRGVLDRL